jgi:hypothetical protein
MVSVRLEIAGGFYLLTKISIATFSGAGAGRVYNIQPAQFHTFHDYGMRAGYPLEARPGFHVQKAT